MKSVAPPTAFHARTGELTAPGITAAARANSAAEFFFAFILSLCSLTFADVPVKHAYRPPEEKKCVYTAASRANECGRRKSAVDKAIARSISFSRFLKRIACL